MPFDYKKEYKELYMPKNKPSIVEVPNTHYCSFFYTKQAMMKSKDV